MRSNGFWLTSIVLIAIAFRTLFYTGFFGSDEVVYNNAAFGVLSGQWPVSYYEGALRYGINIPVAFFMSLWGVSEFSANFWSLLCSIGEVILVYLFGKHTLGMKTAILAGLILATLPLHVHFAGRMMADPPLALFISLTFCLFYWAEQRKYRAYYLLSGLSLGCVYWVKSGVAILVLPVFLFYVLWIRRFRGEWIWVFVGALSMVMLNIMLMWWVTGDPLHTYHTKLSGIKTIVANQEKITSPGYYFDYLFLNIRHTWLLGPLALLGIWQASKENSQDHRKMLWFLGIWVIVLVAVLSFTVISLQPFKFIFKQTNYMLIFSAPMALLAGYFVSKQSVMLTTLILILIMAGGFVLSGLEQQAIRVFVANSKAAIKLTEDQPFPVYGTQQASVLSKITEAFDSTARGKPIKTFQHLKDGEMKERSHEPALAVLDLETIGWGDNPPLSPKNVPGCWELKSILQPIGFGLGFGLLSTLRNMVDVMLPMALSERVLAATDSLYYPKPAFLYLIPAGCRFSI